MNSRVRVCSRVLVVWGMLLVCAWSSEERWWTRSSLVLPEPERPVLWHAEIAGGAEHLNGNESGNAVKGRWLGVVRYKRLSTYIDGNVDYQDKDYGQLGSIKQTSYMTRGTLRYDLYKEWYTSAGVVSERDDPAFIARRESAFWGIGQHRLLPGNVSLSLFGAYGHERSRYNKTVAALFDVTDTDDRAGAIVLSQQLRWQATPQFAISQDGMLVSYIEGDQRDRWKVGGGPELSLLPHLSLMVRYEARIEDNPVLQAISGDRRNESVTVMLRLHY